MLADFVRQFFEQRMHFAPPSDGVRSKNRQTELFIMHGSCTVGNLALALGNDGGTKEWFESGINPRFPSGYRLAVSIIDESYLNIVNEVGSKAFLERQSVWYVRKWRICRRDFIIITKL